MEIELLKKILMNNRRIISKIKFIKRDIYLEDGLNYVFVGLPPMEMVADAEVLNDADLSVDDCHHEAIPCPYLSESWAGQGIVFLQSSITGRNGHSISLMVGK